MPPKKETPKPPPNPHLKHKPPSDVAGLNKHAVTSSDQHSSLLSEDAHASYLSTYNDKISSSKAMQKCILENEMDVVPATGQPTITSFSRPPPKKTVNQNNGEPAHPVQAGFLQAMQVSGSSSSEQRRLVPSSSRPPLPSGGTFTPAAESPPSPPIRHPTPRMRATVASSSSYPLPTSNENQQHESSSTPPPPRPVPQQTQQQTSPSESESSSSPELPRSLSNPHRRLSYHATRLYNTVVQSHQQPRGELQNQNGRPLLTPQQLLQLFSTPSPPPPPRLPQPSSLISSSAQTPRLQSQHPSYQIHSSHFRHVQQNQGQHQNLNALQQINPSQIFNAIQPQQNPMMAQPNEQPSMATRRGDDALALHENRIDTLGEFAEGTEGSRMSGRVATILRSLRDMNVDGDTLEQRELRQPPTPHFGDTALGHIKAADKDQGCTFCLYESDEGIREPKFWHSQAAAKEEMCKNCERSTNSFNALWTASILAGNNYNDVSYERLNELKALPNQLASSFAEGGETESEPTIVRSKIDGRDITQYMGVRFCAASPYGHVDVAKVRICDECRDEKAKIMRHRHERFVWIYGPEDGEGGTTDRLKARRCMVCVGYATQICAGCPLRLCEGCEVTLKQMCKSWLDNLFYHYNLEHLRNDAFLLRADGGGLSLEK